MSCNLQDGLEWHILDHKFEAGLFWTSGDLLEEQHLVLCTSHKNTKICFKSPSNWSRPYEG